VFQNPTAGGVLPPVDLTGMPSFDICICPEPTALALCGLGAGFALILQHKKRNAGL
jgi:hypothetical protein